MTKWSPMLIICIGVLVLTVVCIGYMQYEKELFKATATEECEQIVDYVDNKTVTVREGNYVNTKVIYHGYDVCRSKTDGNITSRTSIGYGTEPEISLYPYYKMKEY